MIVDERTSTAPVVEEAPRIAPPAGRGWWRTPLGAVIALLSVAALTELLLIRTLYRVGIYIPKDGPFRIVYQLLTAVGSFAMNLSSVLVVVALALLAAQAWRRGQRSVAYVLGAFLATSLLLAAIGTHDLGPMARLVFMLGVAVVAWPFVRTSAGVWPRVAVAGVALSALLSSYAGLVADATWLVPSGHGPGGAVGAQLAAEALVVMTAFAFCAAWIASDGPQIRPLLVGLGPAVALLLAWRANGAITGILVLWTAGLRLYLPVGIYAIAMWVFSSAAVGWLARHGWRSAGLVLILVAGLLLESTYLQGLLLVALVLLTDGAAVGGLVEPAPPAGKVPSQTSTRASSSSFLRAT